MNKDSPTRSYKKLSEEALGSIDTVIYLIHLYGERIEKLSQNLGRLPEYPNFHEVLKLLDDTRNSFNSLRRITVRLIPLKDRKKDELLLEFWEMHSAFIMYHYDATALLEHTLTSAFTGYYTVAYLEMRSALEDIVEGAIYDLLSIPQYLERAERLRKIKSFKFKEDSTGFEELIEILKKELNGGRLEKSAQIFDIIDDKLETFNPEAKPSQMLLQLKDWGIISKDDLNRIIRLYQKLSAYVHRLHPKFSEVGRRIEAEKDWLVLEPVPEVLCGCLRDFIDLCGWLLYITARVFRVDLVEKKYQNRLNKRDLRRLIKDARKFAEDYYSWQHAINEIESILKTR